MLQFRVYIFQTLLKWYVNDLYYSDRLLERQFLIEKSVRDTQHRATTCRLTVKGEVMHTKAVCEHTRTHEMSAHFHPTHERTPTQSRNRDTPTKRRSSNIMATTACSRPCAIH